MIVYIVDDDVNFINKIEKDFLIQSQSLGIDLKIKKISHNFKESLFNQYFDIIFLDIDLIHDNGISIAKQFLHHPLIVYTSSHANLIFDTLQTQPFYFIRKTEYQIDFLEFIKLFKEYIKKNMTYVFTSRNTKTLLNTNQILYLESFNHSIIIHTIDSQKYMIHSTLNDELKKLPSYQFVRIHHSYVINLNNILQWNAKEIILQNHQKLPIGRNYKQDFIEKYEESLL